MKKNKLSVVLAVYNEQENLGRCLESIKNIADEIVIVDGGSTDKTIDIAKKYKAKVISTDNPPNFHINKNKAIDAASGEWILQLDADEVVSPELAAEIKQVITKNTFQVKSENLEGVTSGYWLNRRNWFLDRFLTKGGQYPDPTLRLYRRGFGRLPAQDVHEQAEVQGPTSHLKNDLLHYRDTSFAKYFSGFDRYTTFIAGQLLQQKLRFNFSNTILYLFLNPLFTFISIYFRHRGYVDGFPGFVFAVFSGLVHGVAYIKFWQKKYYPV